MKKYRFFFNESFVVGDVKELNFYITNKIFNVLRLKVKDIIFLFNIYGFEAKILIEKRIDNITLVKVLDVLDHYCKMNVKVNVAQVVSNDAKMNLIISKLSELGINSFTPLFSDRSTIKFDRYNFKINKLNRWKNIVLESCRQNGSFFVPEVCNFNSLIKWVGSVSNGFNFVLDRFAKKNFFYFFNNSYDINLLIGPEGGFTMNELKFIYLNNFHGVSLSTDKVLKMETASICSVAILQLIFGNLG